MDAPDLLETFELFQQQIQLYFSVGNIKIDKQLDNLLLALGANGLQIYNSWSLDSSENNTDNVFIKFQDHLEPHANYWFSRLLLQQIRQTTEETVDKAYNAKHTPHSEIKHKHNANSKIVFHKAVFYHPHSSTYIHI